MDIIFSGALILLNIYLFIMVGLESPAPTETELGAAFWPRIILVLLIILLAVNLVSCLRAKKSQTAGEAAKEEKIDFAGFFKSKLFIGMVMVVILSIILPILGFIPTSLIFLIAYGILLGADNKGKLVLVSVLVTLALYLIFQTGLQIMLPRGVGIFREIAITLESMLRF